MTNFEKLKNGLDILMKEVRSILISDVQGGISVFLDLFFLQGCIHQLNAVKNLQYLDLLILYNTIEKLIYEIRSCLDSVDGLIMELRKKLRENPKNDYMRQEIEQFIVKNDEET